VKIFSIRGAGCAVLLCVISAGAPAESTGYDQVRRWIDEHNDAGGLESHAGETIRADRLDILRPYLPPGYFEQFDFPDIAIDLQATSRFTPHPDYLEVTRAHGGQAAIGVDGRLENHVAGLPFSIERIKAAPVDQAGYMVGWNNIHRWQYYGYRLDELVLNYIKGTADQKSRELPAVFEGGGALDRTITMIYQRVYLSRLAMLAGQDFRMDIADSERLYYKDYMDVLDPFDVAGTKFVIERSLDPVEEDQVYSYLPTERRVRRLSAKERADSFMGSDYTLDDMEAFSGRVLDFTWEYLGEKHILHVSDAAEPVSRFFGPMSKIARDRWQVRPCFVVELKSHWEQHPYGRKVMFVDQETFNVTLALIFNRDDVLWKTIATNYRWPADGPAHDASLNASFPRWQASVASDLLNDRVTIARTARPNKVPKVTAVQVRRLFSVSNLTAGR
jgi:hypothetical protein